MCGKNWVTAVAILMSGLCFADVGHALAPRKKLVDPVSGESLAGRHGRRIDVVFVIDVTGSMRPKMEFVENGVEDMVREILSGVPRPEVRFGLVIYRDRGESFTARSEVPLSFNLLDFYTALRAISAARGGEDRHEDVAAAIATAIYKMDWDKDKNTERHIYLVGDAPPHPEYTDAPSVVALAAVAHGRGIIVNTVACSLWGELIDSWRTIAALSGGTFSFIVPGETVFGFDEEVMIAFGYGKDIFVADGKTKISSWEELVKFVREKRFTKASPGVIRAYIRKDGDALDRYLTARLASIATEE